MNYREAAEYLDGLQLHKIKLGLEAMEDFLDKVDRPDRKLRFVHVAGTNGKGSVSVNIVSILAQAGYSVGLFTSPHLSSVRERFRINDRFITEQEFARHASRVREVLGEDMITYFEFTTAVALLWFEENRVDLVVLETGLGGRLDATNVVEPLVTIITNISMDHEMYLGTTLQSIAFEKAGIIKKETPLVTGEEKDVCLDVIERRCRELGAPVHLYGRDFLSEKEEGGRWRWRWAGSTGETALTGLICGVKGEYQISNSSLAVCCTELLRSRGFTLSEDHVRDGLRNVRWPGRLEYIVLDRKTRQQIAQAGGGFSPDQSLRYLIDGAHNPAGVESLVTTLKTEYAYQRLVVVWGAMEDKDLSLTVPAIAAMASTIVLTRPQGDRSARPSRLLEVIPRPLQDRCHCIEDVSSALQFAEEHAAPGDLIVVAGSLYLIGEIRQKLVGDLVP